ncbi:uncharacterized protein [Branchiostoma lanceolatum]|uniref:uncharacterized protein isoform X1 n=1 Tax=Branchiostoma lanceolatum TaxID=7740 RepID=UPI00345713E2
MWPLSSHDRSQKMLLLVSGLFLVLWRNVEAAAADSALDQFSKTAGSGLSVVLGRHLYKYHSGVDAEECAGRCVQEVDFVCRSFDINKVGCYVIAENWASAPEDKYKCKSPECGWDHFERLGLKPTEKNEVCFTKEGKIAYNPDTQTCCIDGVKEGAENKHICKTCGSTMFAMPKDGPTWRCCGSKRDVPYNPDSHHCCFGNVREGPEEETACFRCGKNVVSIPEKEADDWMCCGKKNKPYNTKKEHCCFGEVREGSDEKFQCQKCGKKVFSKPKSDPSWRCCGKKNDMPYNPDTHHCCFHEVKEGSQKEHMCQRCGDNVFSKMISEPSYKCCGPQMEPYNPNSHHCCFNEVRKGSEKKNVCQRCGANVFSRPASDQSWWCCGNKDLPYNPTSHTCCGGDVLKGPDDDNVCQKCGDVSFLRPKTDSRWHCCGDDNTPYNPKTHYCCFGQLKDGAESQYTCLRCGKKVSTVPANGPVWGCCADLAYNTEKQVCCKDEVFQGTKCDAPGVKPASDLAEQTKQGEDPGAYNADPQGSEAPKEPAFKPEGEEAGTGGCSVNTGGRQSATQICCGNRFYPGNVAINVCKTCGAHFFVDTLLETPKRCCGEAPMNPETQVCCRGKVVEGKSCDGSPPDLGAQSSDPAVDTALLPSLTGDSSQQQVCNVRGVGLQNYDPKRETCCGEKLFDGAEDDIYCRRCRDVSFVEPKSGTARRCCGNTPFNPESSACCGEEVFNPLTQVCCDNRVYPGKTCPRFAAAVGRLDTAGFQNQPLANRLGGTKAQVGMCKVNNINVAFDENRQLCCENQLFDGATRRTHNCRTCGGIPFVEIINADPAQRCCGAAPFNPNTHTCCDEDRVVPGQDCYQAVDQPDVGVLQPPGGSVGGTKAEVGMCKVGNINVAFDENRQLCCENQLFDNANRRTHQCRTCAGIPFVEPIGIDPHKRCCGANPFNPSTQTCCDGGQVIFGQDCFAGLREATGSVYVADVNQLGGTKAKVGMCKVANINVAYDPRRQICCENRIFDGPEEQTDCRTCGGDPFVEPRGTDPASRCCGLQQYRPNEQVCCQGQLLPFGTECFGGLSGGGSQFGFVSGQDPTSINAGAAQPPFLPSGPNFFRPAQPVQPGVFGQFGGTKADVGMCRIQLGGGNAVNIRYDPTRQICCENQIFEGTMDTVNCRKCGTTPFVEPVGIDPAKRCCGQVPFNPTTHVCCDGSVVPGQQCYGGLEEATGTTDIIPGPQIPTTQQGNKAQTEGCRVRGVGDLRYDPNTHICCGDQIMRGPTSSSICMRCGNTIFVQPMGITADRCCAGEAFNPDSESCCDGVVFQGLRCPQAATGQSTAAIGPSIGLKAEVGYCQVDGRSQPFDPSRKICCGNQLYDGTVNTLNCRICGTEFFVESPNEVAARCCGPQRFNPETQVCCDGIVTGGRTCPNVVGPDFASLDQSAIVGLCDVNGYPQSYNPSTHICCRDGIHEGPTRDSICRTCGSTTFVQRRGVPMMCCGNSPYDPRSSTCCNGRVSQGSSCKHSQGGSPFDVNVGTAQYVNPGETVTLTCTYSPASQKADAITWSKGNNRKSDAVLHSVYGPRGYGDFAGRVSLIDQASLSIKDVRPEDTGKYTCAVQVGKSRVSGSLQLFVSSQRQSSESGCLVENRVYRDQERFRHPSQSCMNCVCQGREVSCQPKQCPPATCPNPRKDECCQTCNGCSFSGEDYNNGDQFQHSSNPCRTCHCMNGHVRCMATTCPTPKCPNAVTQPGQCCPQCPGAPAGGDSGCIYEGSTYSAGQQFNDPRDTCRLCNCQNGAVNCRRRPCPAANCPYPVIRDCCRACDDCSVDGQQYRNGEEFADPRDECLTCQCSNGHVVCNRRECPDTTCANAITRAGECCPVCEGSTVPDALTPRPTAPTGLSGYAVDAKTISVQWRPPPNTLGLRGYRVFYQKIGDSDPQSTDTESRDLSYNIRGVEPFTDYQIWVTSYGIGGESERSNKIVVRTSERTALAPQDVTATAVDSQSVLVEWRHPVPSSPTARITGYRILYKQASESDDQYQDVGLSTTDTSFTIRGLNPYTEYDVIVATASEGGDEARSMPVRVRTAEGTPGPVGELTGEADGDTSIKVSWQPPTVVNGVLQGYRIYYQRIGDRDFEEVEVSDPRETSYLLTDLRSNARYRIWMIAFNGAVDGLKSQEIIVNTGGEYPQVPGVPLGVRVFPEDPTTIRVQWQAPSLGGTLSGYRIHYQVDGDSLISTVEAGPNARSQTITGLQPGTTYNVWVVAYSSAGVGRRSQRISITTQEIATDEAPGPPRNVRMGIVNPTSVQLDWVAPIPGGYDISEPVKGYRILYQRVGVRVIGEIEVDSSVLSYTLTGLNPNAEYTIWIQAFTETTDGRRSEALQLPRRESVEEVALPSAPIGVSANALDSRSIRVQWSQPEGDPSSIQGYRVLYRRAGDDSMVSAEVGADQTAYTISSLSSDTDYEIQVLAYTESGDGDQSGPVLVRTPTAPGTREIPEVDCYKDTGDDYRGTASTTEKGEECVSWGASDVFQYGVNEFSQGEFGIGDHNYCRNPDGDIKPWCYVDLRGTYEYCDLKRCVSD